MEKMNSSINPDFKALKTALANNSIEDYTVPAALKRQPTNKPQSVCPSGKALYNSIDEVMKAKNTVGSLVRFKRYYRCCDCGRFHFSGKEEEPTKKKVNDKRRSNESLRSMVTLYRTCGSALEYYAHL